MLKLLMTAIIFYLGAVAMLYFGQRRVMYHPVQAIASPLTYGLTRTEERETTASDGTHLALWVTPTRAGFPTLLYFHGNAGNLADRAAIFQGFSDAGFGLVALEYRGFGKSGGTVSEYGIYQDARATIDFAQKELHLKPSELIYYGESLGSGVAVQMATERPPALLMLEAAYTSVTTRSEELFPYVLGLKYLLKDHYDSLAKIGQVHVPLVMIHGENDPVIPLRHAQTLFAAANEPKTLTVYPNVGHVDFSEAQRTKPLLGMAKRVGLIP